jgi:phosphatidylinositol glycan class B
MVCNLVAFHYYRKQADHFNLDTIFFTALLSISFVMRNTSAVGWIPLLMIKILYEGSFKPFLISGFIVAIPLLGMCVWLDSLFYMRMQGDQEFKLVVTSLNFLKINVLQGLSKYFGDHNFSEYIFKFLPLDNFRLFYPFLILGMYSFWKEQRKNYKQADIVYLCLFYLTFFSLIGHKEKRFMLPILPFMFLILGY